MEEMISDIYSIPLAYILTYDTRMIRVSCQYAYQIYAYHTKIGNTRMYTSYEHAYVFHIYERAFRGTRIINEHLTNTNIVWV